jgi:hypothetical protein
MLTIDTYTASYDSAMRPSAPRVGSLFRLSVSADAREYDGFRACLTRAGLDWEYVRHMPRLNLDVCRVIKAAK